MATDRCPSRDRRILVDTGSGQRAKRAEKAVSLPGAVNKRNDRALEDGPGEHGRNALLHGRIKSSRQGLGRKQRFGQTPPLPPPRQRPCTRVEPSAALGT